MNALTPAMLHGLAVLAYAIAALIKAIWPNGIRR
jgi:hypothetical protein